MQDLFNQRETGRNIVVLEQRLLLFEINGQNLDKAPGHPYGVVVLMLQIFVQATEVVQNAFKDRLQELVLIRQRHWLNGRQEFDLAHVESVDLPLGRAKAETLTTNGRNTEQSVTSLVPVCYARESSNIESRRRPGFMAVSNQQDTKRNLVFHAAADHIEVARLEYPERQGAAREKDCIKREKRDTHSLSIEDQLLRVRCSSAVSVWRAEPNPPLLMNTT